MNSKIISLIFALLSLYLTDAFPLVKRSCSKTYKVVKGDTCYKIWTKNGLSESQFRKLNSGIDCSNLKVGASICLKGSSSTSTSSSCKSSYTIKSGDTCYKIWKNYGLSESQFRSLNSGIDCSNLKKGSSVCVSGSSSGSSSCSSHYTIKKGDTCYKIYKNYGMSETAFKNINPGINCSNLHSGDKVCVKSSTITKKKTSTKKTSSKKKTTTTKKSTSTTSASSTTFTWHRECVNSNNYALTFDDGVYLYDGDLLDLLKKKGIKASFFINGNNMSDIKSKSVRDIIKRMYNEGHNVLSHTWSHSDLTTLSYSSARSELKLLEDEIYSIIGKRPKSIRPPFMAGVDSSSVVEMLKYYGYRYGILWYVDTEDWKNKGNVDTVLNFIKQGLANSSKPIILNHSYYQGITKEKLLNLVEQEIDYLASNGLKGVNMETCLGHSVYRYDDEGFPN